MLGHDVVRRLDTLGLSHVDSDMDCDITDPAAVRSFTIRRPIEWIVNCSAYTSVDDAEDEEMKADAVNAIGPANLGRAAVELGARVIHLSTDYVFDGEASSPYTEESRPAPRGAYGRTKLSGEKLLAETTSEHYIVRTAWLYGVHGKNFVYTMLRLMNENDEVSVVDDQRGSPTYTFDLATALCTIISADSRAYGIYHYANEGETTWFQFARSIYELGRASGRIGRSCEVRPITTDRYPRKAARPKYSVLSKDKIKQTLGIAIPDWQDGLERFFGEIEEEEPT
jgi:dTDP-4-dehydrorhamnose reductase